MNKEGTLPWPQLRFRSLWRSPGCPRQGKAASGRENWQTWAGAGGYGLQLAQESCWSEGLPPCGASVGGAKPSSLVSNRSSTFVAVQAEALESSSGPTPHVTWQQSLWFYRVWCLELYSGRVPLPAPSHRSLSPELWCLLLRSKHHFGLLVFILKGFTLPSYGCSFFEMLDTILCTKNILSSSVFQEFFFKCLWFSIVCKWYP